MRSSLVPVLLFAVGCSAASIPTEDTSAILPGGPIGLPPPPRGGGDPEPEPPSGLIDDHPAVALSAALPKCLGDAAVKRLRDKVTGLIANVGEPHVKAYLAGATFDSYCNNGTMALGLWHTDPGPAARQGRLAELVPPGGDTFAFHFSAFALRNIVDAIYYDTAQKLTSVSLNSHTLTFDGAKNELRLHVSGSAAGLPISVEVDDQVDKFSIAGCRTATTVQPSIDITNMLITTFTPTWIQVHPDLSQIRQGIVCRLLHQLPAQITPDVTQTLDLTFDQLLVNDAGITAGGIATQRARRTGLTVDVWPVTIDEGPVKPITLTAVAVESELLDPITWSWTLDGKPVTGDSRRLSVTVPQANVEQHVIGVTAVETMTDGVSVSASSGVSVTYVAGSQECFGPTGKPVACPPPCKPKTCAQLSVTCGATTDGCGTPLDCGACCVPRTCGSSCGTIADGCGGTLACRACPHVKDPACMSACLDVFDNCVGNGLKPNACNNVYKNCTAKC